MASASTTEADSRLRDFDLQGLHQVIVISQANINDGLGPRFRDEVQPELLTKINIETASGLIDAKLGAPTIELCANKSTSVTQSTFFLQIKSGTFHYLKSTMKMSDLLAETDNSNSPSQAGIWTTGDPFPSQLQFASVDITGWRLPFLALYNEETLARPDDNDNSAVKSTWKKLDPGRYSLSRIVMLVGLRSHSFGLVDWDRALCPNLDKEANGVEEVRRLFAECIELYLGKLNAHPNALVLGYTIKETSPDPNAKASTFPPTAVKVQNYRYRPCSDTQAVVYGQPVPPGSRDAFLFLGMTGHSGFPVSEIQSRGNLLIGDMPGALVFSKEVFFKKYLVEHALKDANIPFIDILNDLLVWAGNNWGDGWVLTEQTREDAISKLGWTVHGKEANVSWSGRRGPPTIWAYCIATSSLNTKLLIKPRTNKIVFETLLQVQSTTVFVGQEVPETRRGSVKVTVEFRITVNEDGLMAVETSENIDCFANQDSPVNPSQMWFGETEKTRRKHIKEMVKEKVKARKIANGLAACLNNRKQFVFPRSGTFSYKDPQFSDNGDLMITLELVGKGIEKEEG
ncbi:hypothetical protein QBC45DRAFT_446829 [Copromyces sp. CBS 386.78]|nr:hypothetical protein QBC45DRAFT_446829 [Copromyces sp. CBS 386.78]